MSSPHALKTFHHLLDSQTQLSAHSNILLLVGAQTPYRNDTDRELPFRQESNFFYLSALSIPSSLLLLTSNSPHSVNIHLFIPPVNPSDLLWSIPPPTPESLTKTLDPTTTTVALLSSFPDTLNTLLATLPNPLIHTLPRDSPLFPQLPPEHAHHLHNAQITDAYLLPALHRARLTKFPHEISQIRKANEISSRAHQVVMRVLGAAVNGSIARTTTSGRPLLPSEWLIEKEAEAEAIFVASCRREGAVHQAYLPIVASSTRASTLHYCCNDREFAWGPVGAHDHQNDGHISHDPSTRTLLPQVLLIDAGCEWDCYASDITRTMPVGNGGKFTPEARAIYELVLEMQSLSMKALKPGVHWDSIQLLCHRTLIRGFLRLGIFVCPGTTAINGHANPESESESEPEAKIIASGASAAFFPHGVGHSLGLDVHDVPSASKPVDDAQQTNKSSEEAGGHPDFYTYLRLRLPLQVGMVVTVEPGIYFSPHLLASIRGSEYVDHEVLKRYEDVGGVRIEDVVLITQDGYENLTTVRSDVEWIEQVCSGEI